jgi:hypothetical protein
MLAMAGMALVAGATFSAGPAAASSTTAQGTTATKQSSTQTADANRGRDWVQGYYRTYGQCNRVGWIGERRGLWDDYECERVRRGFRTFFRLEVERDWHGGGHWNNGNGNGNGHGHGGHWNDRDRDRGHHGPRR